MRAVRGVIAVIVMLGLVGCGGSKPPVMPDVVGKKLDIALSDVKRAGFNSDVEVLGGGVLGVIDKANWTVCEQEPAAGQAIAGKPRVKVDRTCGGAAPQPTAAATAAEPPPTETPRPTPSLATASDQPPLTVSNNADFAALAQLTDDCSASQTEFASKYAGLVLQFDGSIAAMANHGNYKTRYDILVTFGDNGRGTKGPNFQFRDVNLTFDLHLSGSNIPETIRVGDNLRVVAAVDTFEPNTCLFLLKPVSTQYR